MKKLALAVTAFAALSGQALAADMPMKAVRPAPVVAAANWTGCYIGGGIGYGLFDQENTGYYDFYRLAFSPPHPVDRHLGTPAAVAGSAALRVVATISSRHRLLEYRGRRVRRL